jgi:hypothetical protein
MLASVITPFDPELIIELGTSWGGLTKFFEDYTKAIIYSYDRPGAARKPNPILFTDRVTFCKEDVLICNAGIIGLCQGHHRKLLYTDNGNKVKEVVTYAPFLNTGDMLGVHDWPREIYYEYDLLKPAAAKHVTREDIEALNVVLMDFIPWCHYEFLQLGLSTRFWIKK